MRNVTFKICAKFLFMQFRYHALENELEKQFMFDNAKFENEVDRQINA